MVQRRVEKNVHSRTVPALMIAGYQNETEAASLRWAGHLQTVGNNEICRGIVDSKLEESKRVERSKHRWMMVWWKIWGSWGSR